MIEFAKPNNSSVTRDVAGPLHFAKPSLLHSRFLDALQGPGSKMSASVDASSIKLTDTPKQISKKIKTYAFSGGQETLEEHREKGGNPDIDVPYQYLKFFLDVSYPSKCLTMLTMKTQDDVELAQIYKDYKSGKMLTSEIKQRCADVVTAFVEEFQARRAKITDEIVDEFMRPRPLKFRDGRLSNTMVPDLVRKDVRTREVADPNSKAQQKKLEKARQAELKKLEKAKAKEEKDKQELALREAKKGEAS
jgi:tryptophanyl-tRNA synthetase